jgi:hypothetical protein
MGPCEHHAQITVASPKLSESTNRSYAYPGGDV